jgi:small-conductance mechanosensitive channel
MSCQIHQSNVENTQSRLIDDANPAPLNRFQISGIALIPFTLVVAILMGIIYTSIGMSITRSIWGDFAVWLAIYVLFYASSLGLMYVPF